MAKRLLLAALAFLLIGATGAFWYASQEGDDSGRYLTARVERGTIEETVPAIGTVQPYAYVDVGTQVSGQLKALRVAVGDQVQARGLLAEIDPTLFASRVDAARASLRSLQAQLAERIAQHQLARQQYERNLLLFTSDGVSKESLEQSTAAEAQAAAQVAVSQALIDQAGSQLRADEANLRYTKIYAPMAGTVVSITAHEGQTLVASQQAPVILRIANLGTMTVWAQVSEADEPKIRLGMPVYFNTLGQSERRWQGVVRQILPTPDTINNVVLYNVLFDVDNPDAALKPQMSAQVYVVLAEARHALLVPAAALQTVARKGGRSPREDAASGAKELAPTAVQAPAAKARSYRVKVLRDDGQIEERQVKVGLVTRLQAEMLSGLAEGETVVVGIAADRAGKKDRPKDGGKSPKSGARLGRRRTTCLTPRP